ncbi:hypothetical protein LCL89_10190 [Halobacillus yeomjeoni]|uniref:hypothetical protein n=1 Tax=Halobacillus yeomjeoni TaxID=311194 RepID=UPI001CD7A0CD|nr:hypothetical protein [Halobacillus yeomjeoni]MCA0984415.1 hypothetical protein [Halobacillus yeomjeoni]
MEFLFLLASVIAVIGIAFVSSKMMTRLSESKLDENLIQKEQTKFFISSAIVEIVPIVLIVVAFASLENSTLSTGAVYISIGLMVIVWLTVLAKVFMKGQETVQSVEENYKQQVKGVVFISLAFLSGIPLASIFMLFNL